MRLSLILVLTLLAASLLPAQQAPAAANSDDFSGMYTFLKDGEFVQITVEDGGRVTGFVSRYGDSEGDRGVFLDQFFKQGKLDGPRLTFTTATIHGVWFDFKGTVDRGEGKTPADEAYHVVTGTLTEFHTDADKKVSSQDRQVKFKSFPQEATTTPKN